MKLLFKNRWGTVTMCGNGKDYGWKILEIQGLGLPEKMYTYNTYVGVAGQEVASCSVAPRCITVKVDLAAGPQSLSLQKAARILNEDGELTIYHKNRRRAISCRCISFVKTEKRAPFVQGVLQFEADNPYFHDCQEKSVSVATRTKLLKNPVTLPCVLSSRVRKKDVVVSGDVMAEPVIIIRGTEENSGSNITIINHTTQERISLNYVPALGETVEINIPRRRVIKTVGSGEPESFVDALSDESYLSKFTLSCGVNQLEIVCDCAVTVSCNFCDQYLEAMY